MPAPQKMIVEFLAHYLSDSEFRCQVLYNERATMRRFGLNADQYNALISLKKSEILDRIVRDFKDSGVDVDRIRDEIWNDDRPPVIEDEVVAPANEEVRAIEVEELFDSSAYEEGTIHIRRREPTWVEPETDVEIFLGGQGFDPTPDSTQVTFVLKDPTKPRRNGLPGGHHIEGRVTDCACGIDVFQRVKVEVNFPKSGRWLIFARHISESDGDWHYGKGDLAWVGVSA